MTRARGQDIVSLHLDVWDSSCEGGKAGKETPTVGVETYPTEPEELVS